MQTFPNAKKSAAINTVTKAKVSKTKVKRRPRPTTRKSAATPDNTLSAADSLTKTFGNPKQSVEGLRRVLEKRREALGLERDKLEELKGAVEDQLGDTNEAMERLIEAIDALSRLS